MTYKVLTAKTTNALSRKVNDAIEDGWKPIGGIAISVVGESLIQTSSINVAQAMTIDDQSKALHEGE